MLVCWSGQYSQWSLQTSRAESQGVWSSPRTGFCAALHPLLGAVSCLNTFSIFFLICLVLSLPSLAWSGEHPVLGGRSLLEADYVLDCFIKWDLPFGGRMSWQGAEKALGTLPSSWFRRVPPSVSCCTVGLDCSSHILNQHSSTITTSIELPCRKKGDSTVLKRKPTKSFQSYYYKKLLKMSKKGEEWRQGRMKERGVTQVNVSCHSFRVSWYF